MTDEARRRWWAKGLLFENCNCQVVCPGHVHFDQLCTHERCVGYWAIRFDDGRLGEVDLRGVRAVIAYDTPQHMIDGGWTQVIVVDEAATGAQCEATEAILSGRVGGPWQVLARFVGQQRPIRRAVIEIVDEPLEKRIRIPGLLRSVVRTLRGRDREAPVRFENMFNQIHDTSQVLGAGTTESDDGEIVVSTEGTHGLWSRFSWAVSE